MKIVELRLHAATEPFFKLHVEDEQVIGTDLGFTSEEACEVLNQFVAVMRETNSSVIDWSAQGVSDEEGLVIVELDEEEGKLIFRWWEMKYDQDFNPEFFRLSDLGYIVEWSEV